jgi:hypothetical protein
LVPAIFEFSLRHFLNLGTVFITLTPCNLATCHFRTWSRWILSTTSHFSGSKRTTPVNWASRFKVNEPWYFKHV